MTPGGSASEHSIVSERWRPPLLHFCKRVIHGFDPAVTGSPSCLAMLKRASEGERLGPSKRPREHQTTNLGVGSSNLSGRANIIKDLRQLTN